LLEEDDENANLAGALMPLLEAVDDGRLRSLM
jgi:hypothetical protein